MLTMKKLIAVLLALVLCSGLVNAIAEPTDWALNWYEIFVSSYYDTDGDGIGDLNGVAAKLDYIQDMGYNGLWLMPVFSSPSYHKYDVSDYMSVAPQYGTLENMRALVNACHERGISLILDLPVNHTSTQHPWFLQACAALSDGDTQDPMVGYYHFTQSPPDQTYVKLPTLDWYYEEKFSGGGMPDLNLDNPSVRNEITAVMDFWLNDVGVDGFRLDAVTSFYGSAQENIDFLHWMKTETDRLKPGCFLVGECWQNLNVIAEYYQSGVDSFFLFPASQAEGYIAKAVRSKKPASAYLKSLQKVEETLPGKLIAPFLANHDTGRTIGSVQGRNNLPVAKLAYGLLNLMGGACFTYYGDEIGMAGSGDDPNKRLPMYWNDTDMTLPPPGVTKSEYPLPSVEEQLADEISLLHYCRALNYMKLEYPQIARGKTEILWSDDNAFLMRRAWQEQSVLLAVNCSTKAEAAISVPTETKIGWDLEVERETAALTDGMLTLPAGSIVVLIE